MSERYSADSAKKAPLVRDSLGCCSTEKGDSEVLGRGGLFGDRFEGDQVLGEQVNNGASCAGCGAGCESGAALGSPLGELPVTDFPPGGKPSSDAEPAVPAPGGGVVVKRSIADLMRLVEERRAAEVLA
jgi:hypothetical protein